MSGSIKLWKNNKIDGEYELTFDEVLDKFTASPLFKEPTGRPFEMALMNFITAPEPDGLSSVNDPRDRVTWGHLVGHAAWRGVSHWWVREQGGP